MGEHSSRMIRRQVLGAIMLAATFAAVGCSEQAEEKKTVVQEDPEMKRQVNDMTKFYESNPPGAPAKK